MEKSIHFKWNPFSMFGEAPASARFDGGGNGSTDDDMTAYSFDPETGKFKEAYNVTTGETIKDAAFVSEYDKEGNFTGGYGMGTKGPTELSPNKEPATVENSRESIQGAKPTQETPPAEQPKPSEKSERGLTREQKRRRRTLLSSQGEWAINAPGRMKALLGE